MKLTEVKKKEFMSRKEQLLKKRLIALLKDDGKGHKHPKYAERLADFDINIVPLSVDPDMTAAISFDDGIIYISEGFLTDPSTFFQLNVLMRHEMAHNLMMHQIRMMHKIDQKYGNEAWEHIKMSQSLHSLMNVIEDFEISNKRYSEADKKIVKNMWLNGQLIGGLVTEDHREDWAKLPVEEMYDRLGDEIDRIHQDLLNQWRSNGSASMNFGQDMIKHEIGNLYSYADTQSPTTFNVDLDKLIKSAKFKQFAKPYQDIITSLFNAFTAGELGTNADITDMIQEIALSNPNEEFDIVSPKTGEVYITIYTPEEKRLAVDILKNLRDNTNLYDKWFEKVKQSLGNYSDEDLKKILDGIKGE